MSKALYKIVVKGKRIQRAMFRDFVDEKAREYSLTGFVCNLTNPTRDVLIECEGEEKNIQNFLREIKKLKTKNKEEMPQSELLLIELGNVIAEKRKYNAQYSDFEIIRKEGEVGDRIAEGAHQMMQLRKEFNNKFCYLDEKYGDISKELHALNENLVAIIKNFLETKTHKQ